MGAKPGTAPGWPLIPDERQGTAGRIQARTAGHRAKARIDALKHYRDQCLRLLTVNLIRRAKVLPQPLLLQLQLAPEGREDDGNGQQAAPIPDHHRVAREQQQEAGMDRMPDEAIRPALDEFAWSCLSWTVALQFRPRRKRE